MNLPSQAISPKRMMRMRSASIQSAIAFCRCRPDCASASGATGWPGPSAYPVFSAQRIWAAGMRLFPRTRIAPIWDTQVCYFSLLQATCRSIFMGHNTALEQEFQVTQPSCAGLDCVGTTDFRAAMQRSRSKASPVLAGPSSWWWWRPHLPLSALQLHMLICKCCGSWLLSVDSCMAATGALYLP